MDNSEILWAFKTANFKIEWAIAPDYATDMSFDETGEVMEKLESGEYQAFRSEITVTHIPTGIELGADYLGGSIYANPRDFRDHIGMNKRGHGSYFSDMVRGAIAEARANLKSLCQSA